MSLAAVRIRCPTTAHFGTDPSTFFTALLEHFVVSVCSHHAMRGASLPTLPHVPQPAWHGVSQLLPAHRTGDGQGKAPCPCAHFRDGVFFKRSRVPCLPFILKSASGCTKHPLSKTEAEAVPPVQDSCRARRGGGTLLLSPGRRGCGISACPTAHPLLLVARVQLISLHLPSVPCLCIGGSLLLGCQESSLPLECTKLVFSLTGDHHHGFC